jgi:virginiamycin B lyase
MRKLAGSLLVLGIALGGCSSSGGSHLPGTPPASGLGFRQPAVSQKGNGDQYVQFVPKTRSSLYSAMVLGPDNNVWFIDENGQALVRITPEGASKEFPISGLGEFGIALTVGSDKDFYIGYESSSIVRATLSGKSKVIPIPSGDSTAFGSMGLGPDGNVWFTEFSHIANVTRAGKVTEFPYPSGETSNQFGGVTTGSDGNVWFAESVVNKIGRIVPSSGTITEFPIPVSCSPAPLVLGNDGNVWFFCLTSAPLLGSIAPNGTIATYPIGGTFSSNETLQFCERGPDGEPWCASGNDDTVFRLDTTAHTVTTYMPPLNSGARPDAITPGADGNLWIDTVGGTDQIDVLIPNPLEVSPLSLKFTATGQMKTLTVTEGGQSSWTAKSSNASVASVVQGGKANVFNVTAAGAGSCKITITDPLGNSVAVKVKVT